MELDTKIGSYSVYNHKRTSAFIIGDETAVHIGSQNVWLWVCIEPVSSFVLGIYISEEKHACCCKIHDLLLKKIETSNS